MRDMAAAATAKHQFLSDISDYCNNIPSSSIRIVGGLAGVFSCPDIETLRQSANGTSNRVPLVAAVSVDAPARVRHSRTRPVWVPIEDLP